MFFLERKGFRCHGSSRTWSLRVFLPKFISGIKRIANCLIWRHGKTHDSWQHKKSCRLFRRQSDRTVTTTRFKILRAAHRAPSKRKVFYQLNWKVKQEWILKRVPTKKCVRDLVVNLKFKKIRLARTRRKSRLD